MVVPAQFARLIIAARMAKKIARGASGRRGELCLNEEMDGPATVPVECRLEKLKSLIRGRLEAFLIAGVSIREL